MREIDADKVLEAMEESDKCRKCDSHHGIMCKTCDWRSAMDLIEETAGDQARVMKLDEVKELKHRDEIWVEYGGAHRKLFLLTVGRKRKWGFTFFRHLPLPWDHYGKTGMNNWTWCWRAWTDRPSMKQREETEWAD